VTREDISSLADILAVCKKCLLGYTVFMIFSFKKLSIALV
jgi:hypothetical protein